MFTKIMRSTFLFAFSLAIAGCMVTKGTYLKCVNDKELLSYNLNSLQARCDDIQSENEVLHGEIKKLELENQEINAILEAKSDELSNKIVNLREKIADLETENEGKDRTVREQQETIMELRAEKEESVKELSDAYNAMIDKMKSEISDGQVTITELKGKLTVNMVESILFDLGKAEIRPEGLAVLQKLVDVLKDIKGKGIRVEGHTDNLKIHGALAKRYPTNWELSAARAVNVTRYLQKQGIDPTLLSASAFGEYKPLVSNDTEEGRARNRRIEIVMISKDLL